MAGHFGSANHMPRVWGTPQATPAEAGKQPLCRYNPALSHLQFQFAINTGIRALVRMWAVAPPKNI